MQERQLLENRRALNEARMLGIDCEDTARDIKFNLKSQTEKVQNSTINNL